MPKSRRSVHALLRYVKNFTKMPVTVNNLTISSRPSTRSSRPTVRTARPSHVPLHPAGQNGASVATHGEVVGQNGATVVQYGICVAYIG
jgi:hypothetical protein